MTKPATLEGRETDPAILKHVERCAVFLIKTLCLNTATSKAILTKTITHYGKSTGRYRITIEKI
ncbi:hypothetical protein [Nitrobacter sp.]|uniref:hypothetical protein n=1 Tax=Nitrobacter sp. TaxID=29420 RepID=UPI001D610857|nr:hypothetical protein [Nitrobacter sp.]MCB1392887.1 hypothetical protein [Nitrobacter sp.]